MFLSSRCKHTPPAPEKLSTNSVALSGGGRRAVSAPQEIGGDRAPPSKSWQFSDSPEELRSIVSGWTKHPAAAMMICLIENDSTLSRDYANCRRRGSAAAEATVDRCSRPVLRRPGRGGFRSENRLQAGFLHRPPDGIVGHECGPGLLNKDGLVQA